VTKTLTGTRTGTTALPQVVPARTFFPGAEAVDMAADAVADLLGHEPGETFGRRGAVSADRKTYALRLAPGVLALTSGTIRPDKDRADWIDRLPVLFGVEETEWPGLDESDQEGKRRAITEWSRASRARFHRRMGELDYTPWQGKRLAMVTLTLPAHWQRIAPTGADFKARVDALRHRWEAAIGTPLYAVWKLEFQARGAPHLHMLCDVPEVIAGEYGPTWIGRTWVEVCDPQGADRERMMRAHLPSHKRPAGVCDFSARVTDPKRLAVYFGKHAAKTQDSKEYQHIVPAEWQAPGAGPGRFWGYWRLQRAVASVEVTQDEFYRMRRIMRHVEKARAARHALGLRAAARIKGEALRRESLERLQVRKTRRYAGFGGGWTLTNDALILAFDLARAVSPPLC